MVPITHIVVEDQLFELFAGHLFRVITCHNFDFSPRPHTFAFGIVMAATRGAIHALNKTKMGKGMAKINACVLAATVAVADGSLQIVLASGLLIAFDTELGAHIVCQRNPQRHVVVAVEDATLVNLAVAGGPLGNVGYDFLIWCISGKILVQ